jgi:AraC-like DNA-binding protein
LRPNPEKDTELRIGATIAVPDVLRSLGADPAEVLAEAGFDLALFDRPDNLISFSERGRLLAHCVSKTGCQHFGLLVGQQAGLHSLGLTGLLVKYSPDVAKALRNLSASFHLHVRGASTSLVLDGDSAMLCYSITQVGTQANDQVGDGAVAAICNIMHSLCGPEWRPSRVLFAHRKPENIAPFRRIFAAPLIFDAEQNAVVFAADWLKRPLPQSDPEVLGMLQREIGALGDEYHESFPDAVRRVLSAAVFTGQAHEDRIAELFAMHVRTLRRRLQKFETSFEELLEEARYSAAQRLLQETEIPVSKIASTLGYSEASSFTRAFRRWSGLTPSQWRAEHVAR